MVQARIDQVLQTDGAARDVVQHILAAKGKGLRPGLLLLTFDLCGGQDFEEAINCAAGVELVHMASLIHDDIIDQSELRRGQPALYRRFDTQTAVLAGDQLFAAAFHLFALSTRRQVSAVMTQVIQDMCSGEISQLLTPVRTEASYFDYIRRKTARLIGGACRLGAILADETPQVEEDLREFGECLGLAFQLTDDVLDYRGEEQVRGTEAGRDFAEGQWTLPTIRAHERGLISSTWFLSDFTSLWTILEEFGVLGEVLQEAASHIRQAQNLLHNYPPSASKAELMALMDKLIQRTR